MQKEKNVRCFEYFLKSTWVGCFIALALNVTHKMLQICERKLLNCPKCLRSSEMLFLNKYFSLLWVRVKNIKYTSKSIATWIRNRPLQFPVGERNGIKLGVLSTFFRLSSRHYFYANLSFFRFICSLIASYAFRISF